jgi:YD repeat-containing protein
VGNLTVITDTLGNETLYLYDENNRLVEVTDALSQSTSYEYDPNGNLTTKTDANNVATRYEYDALNRLEAVVENYRPGFTPDHDINVRTEYSYDNAGNLIAVRDARAVLEDRQDVTQYTYNDLNRLVSESDPLDNTTYYAYDAEGNRTVITDTLSAATHYNYDALNRLIAIDYPAPDADVSYEYNYAGWRTSMTDGLGDTTWEYNDLGQILSATDPFDQVVGYDYDEAGNRTGLTYPDAKSVEYAYDALDRLEMVTDWAQQVTQYDYDPLSRLEATTLPGGVSSAYVYDALGQVHSIDHDTPGGSLASYQYAYDPLGNRTVVTETLTLPPADLIFSDGFESGDFLGWSGTKTTNPPDLQVTTQAAMVGEYGEQVAPVYNRAAFAYDNSPQAEKRYRARFYFDPNNVSLGNGLNPSHTIFKAYDQDYRPGGGQGTPVFYLELRKYTTTYQLRALARNDVGTWSSTAWNSIPNSPTAIEIDWKSSNSPITSNGFLYWWLGGSAKLGLINLDNDSLGVESVYLGAVEGVDSGTSGWYCFDAFISRRESYTGLEPGGANPCGGSSEGLLAPESTQALSNTLAITDTLWLTAALDISQTWWLTDALYLSGTLSISDTVPLALPDVETYASESPAALAAGSPNVIEYSYDPLGRLTAAGYRDGSYFYYSYDAAGNRTQQTACIGSSCSPVITDYAYDYAQRLESVNEVVHTWDGNGNLLSDGVNSYTYDHANRLTTVSGPSPTVSFGYRCNGKSSFKIGNRNRTG